MTRMGVKLQRGGRQIGTCQGKWSLIQHVEPSESAMTLTNHFHRQKILKLTKITTKSLVTKQLRPLVIVLTDDNLKGRASKYNMKDKHRRDVGQAVPIPSTATKHPSTTLTARW